MKKLFPVLILMLVLCVFASCGKEEDENTALVTADSHVDVTAGNGSVAITEDVAAVILGEFTPEELGLEKTIDEYALKLSPTLVENTDGCLVEVFESQQALEDEASTPAGTFAIVGMDVYIFNAETGFKRLVPTSSVGNEESEDAENTEQSGDDPETESVPESTTAAPVPTEPETINEEENRNNLRSLFAKYSTQKLGLKKDITEYEFIPTPATAIASDGETVYAIRVETADGESTGVHLAFNESGEYLFNDNSGVYEKLS